MPHIQILPDELINQIAAGEVVERPASVVKELVENALDAEATRIDVSISEGGIRRLSVSDDGVGMSRADAELAFHRHATSKLRTADDLAAVGTLGFRGEALPSIASVARVRVRTRRASDPIGVELEGEGAGISRVAEVACPPGTTVEVAELFGLVPARRKFLKSAVTESTQIVRLIERIAMVRTDVRFELERDGKILLQLPPTADPRERLKAVLPAKAAQQLLTVDGELPTMRVTGYCSPTDVMRGTTADIHVYVNARPVRDRLLLHAVREAYRDALPPGRHPVVVLFLNIDPGEVDVNVHPAKQEVRFRDPQNVRRLLKSSLRQALDVRRTLDLGPGADGRPGVAGATQMQGSGASKFRPISDARREPLLQQREFGLARTVFGTADGDAERVSGFDSPSAGEGAAPFSFRELRYVGQAMSTYLLFERQGQLVALDQHAAHERVLFERLRVSLFEKKLERQNLLVPIRVELSHSAASALAEAEQGLANAGFEIDFGETTLTGAARVTLRALPAVLAARTGVDYSELLEETAAMLRDPSEDASRTGLEQALHGILATAACHSATRKGDRLEPEEVQALLRGLDETIWFPNCPHGRPFVSILDEADLERRFLRR
ncbi:MAG: DNA mismatch repair endonuclease MutL [bacterium]|nr:DNA mismatch repair endonuclease MutL [bacterium]